VNKSQQVKDWRNRTKARIVESMGGCCALCGYNKCNWALALHHLDPSKKDFSFASIRANCKSWDKIVVELKKCIMVCHNCHAELHAGMVDLPSNAIYFNESYTTYKPLQKKMDSYCPICNQSKPSYQTTCSKRCAAQNRYHINWDRIDLKEEIRSKSIVKLAEQLGCSDAAIHKRLKKLGLK
jgi:hypothetical protein